MLFGAVVEDKLKLERAKLARLCLVEVGVNVGHPPNFYGSFPILPGHESPPLLRWSNTSVLTPSIVANDPSNAVIGSISEEKSSSPREDSPSIGCPLGHKPIRGICQEGRWCCFCVPTAPG